MAKYFVRPSKRPIHKEVNWQEEARNLSEHMAEKHSLPLIPDKEINRLAELLKHWSGRVFSMDKKEGAPTEESIRYKISQLRNAVKKIEKFNPQNCYGSNDPDDFKRATAVNRLHNSLVDQEVKFGHANQSISLIEWLEGTSDVLRVIEDANAIHDQFQEEHPQIDTSNKLGPFGVTYKTELMGFEIRHCFKSCYGRGVSFGTRKNIDGERDPEGAGYDFVHYVMVNILEFDGITFNMIDNSKRAYDKAICKSAGGSNGLNKNEDDTTDNT